MLLRRTLQQWTREQHKDLDALVAELGCFCEVQGYRRWLRGMLGFHCAIEKALRSSDPYSERANRQDVRIANLLGDLSDLGEIPSLPISKMSLDAKCDADVLGLLYVTEGASLGARVLVERAAALGFTDSYGARHLAAEAASLAGWRAVLDELAVADFDEPAISRAVASSRRAFAIAADCIRGCRHA